MFASKLYDIELVTSFMLDSRKKNNIFATALHLLNDECETVEEMGILGLSKMYSVLFCI